MIIFLDFDLYNLAEKRSAAFAKKTCKNTRSFIKGLSYISFSVVFLLLRGDRSAEV